jgi:hypothetical protein
MAEASQNNDANKALFLELVMMLSTSALQQLGKIINPMTGKTEIHLEAAQATIDMVVMLEAKSKGNLDAEEARFLKNTLAALQMNYVETAQSPAAAAASAPDQSPKPSPEPVDASPAKESPAAAGKNDGKEPKFHKSYG